jgi:hypothetical protein
VATDQGDHKLVNVSGPVYDRMASDAVLVALLATFDGESLGDVPAIFLDMPYVPDTAQLPYVWSYGNVGDSPDDTKVDRGNEISFDIGCYTENLGNKQLVTEIAERVVFLFHRHELAITGATTVIASASGPVPAETDETVLGLMVKIRLRVESD